MNYFWPGVLVGLVIGVAVTFTVIGICMMGGRNEPVPEMDTPETAD